MTKVCVCLIVGFICFCTLPNRAAGGMPYEIRGRSGPQIWEQSGREEIPRGKTDALRLGYDLEGKSKDVKAGSRLWNVISRGPDTVRIQAAEGKLKGYYLNTGFFGSLYLSQKPEDFILEKKGSGK